MKLISKTLLGFTAIAFVACSSDEPAVNPVTPETPDGEVAYMAITISSPESSGTRATTDGGYEASWTVKDEHDVTSVDFYFFEADGSYAFNASATTDFVQNGENDKANVEYIGSKQILILNGVRQNDYPEYVITVLNKPTDFAAGQTMQETADKLAEYAKKEVFVMTTSSFFGNVAVVDENDKAIEGEYRHDAKYFATKLNASDFKTTVADASNTTKPVQIYVERLDAKVQLSISKELTDKYELYDNVPYYKISQTLGGGDNQTGDGNQSQVDLYVKVVGWGLNATAKNSYMSKKLNTNWDAENAIQSGWAWNNAGDWRSFWAEAWTYGIGGKDVNSSDKLNYVQAQSIAESNLSIADNDATPNYTYCYENTNTPDNIFATVDGGSLTWKGNQAAVKNALTTHVVLHTQIYQKEGEEMKPAGELVQYRGILYTGKSYKSLLLNRLKTNNALNFWIPDGDEKLSDGSFKNWKTIDASYLKTKRDDSNGHVLGQIKVSAQNSSEVEDEDNDYTYNDVYYWAEATEDEEAGYKKFESEAKFVAALNAALATVDDTQNPAVGSDGNSDAFYYIPIEHHALSTETEAVEGYYGVVRNHWYKLLVTSFKKVGHLVYTPSTDTTEIIPEGPEDPLYYVGAKINILSWKVVNQTVTDL